MLSVGWIDLMQIHLKKYKKDDSVILMIYHQADVVKNPGHSDRDMR